MNTEVSYLYRDAHNYKNQIAVVVAGEVQFSDIAPYLSEDKYFIPVQIGLDGLNGYDAEIDHPWHEIDPDGFELTEAKPTIDLTAAELIANFKKAHQEGWDENYFNSMLADRLAENAKYIVRLPDTMNPAQRFTIRMQSEIHGSEDFRANSLQEAVSKIIHLYNEATQLNDGVERAIGLVVNPQTQVDERHAEQSDVKTTVALHRQFAAAQLRTAYLTTVHLLINALEKGEAADAVSALLTDVGQQPSAKQEETLIDWGYQEPYYKLHKVKIPHTYTEGDLYQLLAKVNAGQELASEAQKSNLIHPKDVLTVYRGHTSQQCFKVPRQDFIWACDELGIGDPDALDGITAETYVFNDIDNFDLLKSFLKQKELLR